MLNPDAAKRITAAEARTDPWLRPDKSVPAARAMPPPKELFAPSVPAMAATFLPGTAPYAFVNDEGTDVGFGKEEAESVFTRMDERTMARMHEMGFDTKKTVVALNEDKRNVYTATYYLMANAFERKDGHARPVGAPRDPLHETPPVSEAGGSAPTSPCRGRLSSGQKWSDTMLVQCSEVEFMLRNPVQSQVDLAVTLTAAEAGLVYFDKLKAKAKVLGVMQGTLSQWLLPYGEHTAASQQIAHPTPEAALEAIPELHRAQFELAEVADLIAGANGVRGLVRVKIADDNDIALATDAVEAVGSFYRRVTADADHQGVPAFALFNQQRCFSPKKPSRQVRQAFGHMESGMSDADCMGSGKDDAEREPTIAEQ